MFVNIIDIRDRYLISHDSLIFSKINQSSHPAHGMFFESSMRNLNMFGVNYVMSHFSSGLLCTEFGGPPLAVPEDDLDLICDEEKRDAER